MRTSLSGRAQPYAFVFPALAMEIAFVFLPLAIGVYFSLHRVRYLNVGRYVGLDNYWDAITDPLFLNSLAVTAIFSFASLFFTFIAGFALALWLERDSRPNVVLRTIVLIPYIIAMLVGSMLLKWIFSQDGGIMPLFLGPFGLQGFSILADPKTAMAALAFNSLWRDSAFAMILLMAGLKSIPLPLFAAARVDGAGAFYTFYRITLPLMRIPILITIVRLFLHFTNSLTYQLVLTGGGPNSATETVVLRMYQVAFEDHQLGSANAIAILLFLFNVAVVGVIVALFRTSRKV